MEKNKTNAVTNIKNFNVIIHKKEESDSNQTEKTTFREFVLAIPRVVGWFALCFLLYNIAIGVVISFCCVLGFLWAKLFDALLNSAALFDTYQSLFNWACNHTTISVIVIAILYVVGLFSLTWKLTKRRGLELLAQEELNW